MAYYRTGVAMDAEDITQEIFFQMVKSIPKLKDPARFSSWLYRIAINRIKDYHRKKKLLRYFWVSSENDTIEAHAQNHINNPAEGVDKIEFWQEFFQAMGHLSPLEREVFILRFVDQLQIKEIVDVLSKNESTVKTHLYRALKKFKRNTLLHALLEDGPT